MFSTGFGGAERHVIDLGCSLVEKGHDVQLVCRPDFYATQRHRLTAFSDIVLVDARNNWDLPAVLKIRNAVAQFGAQLLHLHLSRASLLGSYAARSLNLPSVATTHNQIKPKYIRWVDRFIATTTVQVKHLRANGVGAGHICHIPNFSFFPIRRGGTAWHEQVPVIVSYGRFVRKKGFDLLIRAFASVVKQYPKAKLILGGEGAEKKALESLAENLGISRNVSFPGWIDDVEAFIAKGHVFVLPSRDEPFGIVLLEVMSKGLPIVTTRVCGPLDVLDDSMAWFADSEDAADLGRALLDCLGDKQLSLEMAQLAQKRYEHEYHIDQVVPKIEAYYETMCAG